MSRAVPFEVEGDGAHTLVHGDALELVDLLDDEGLRGKVDLVYVDPPYASDRDYVAEARLDGAASGRVLRSLAYEDTWKKRDGGLGSYLEMLAPRLEALASLLGPAGTMWVHLDWRAAYLVRVILDEIFGRDAFMNEIVWRRAPNLGRQATSGQFGRTLDTIVVYGKPDAVIVPPTKLEPIEPRSVRWDEQGRPFTSAPRGDYTDASIAKLDAEGRVHRTANGRVYIKYFLVKNDEGVLCRERRVDALWTDIAPLRHASVAERTGYPTQKPSALLERIIACATPPGGLVVDGFAGSGTTSVAAHALGRRSVMADVGPIAIATARARLLRQGAGFRIVRATTTDTTALPVAVDVAKVEVASEDVAREDVAREDVADGPLVRLTLREPLEPLAWAVGTFDGGVFRALWSGTRVLGTKPVPPPREAVVPADRALAVRVWADDGRVATIDAAPIDATPASPGSEVRS